MGNVLVLEASQSLEKVNACRYALLKYLEVYNLKPPATTRVYVYTDRPAFFESFIPFFHQFGIKEVSQTQLKDWRGAGNSSERVKMEIISEVLNHENGNLLFLGKDTYINAPLENVFQQIEKGSFLLHSWCANLHDAGKPTLSRLAKFLSEGPVQQNGQRLSLTGVKIWNQYAVGINGQNKPVMEDVLELNDVIGKKFQNAAVGAFAFSYCFQKAGDVKTIEDHIRYYGNLKEFNQLLNLFFQKNEEESIPNLVKLLHALDISTIQKHKNFYEALPFYKKWLRVITGKNWSIKQYEKKI